MEESLIRGRSVCKVNPDARQNAEIAADSISLQPKRVPAPSLKPGAIESDDPVKGFESQHCVVEWRHEDVGDPSFTC
jgi:hypothetical protein